MGKRLEQWLLIRALPPRPPKLYAVEPVNDIEAHQTFSESCACQPKVRTCHGSRQIIHNAFDGRELVEKYGLM
jgi:hypothetical protein